MVRDNSITASTWLFLLKEGGRWAASDVALKLGLSKREVSWRLHFMGKHGCVKSYDVPDSSWRVLYGVTLDCKVPKEVTVQRVMECVMASDEGDDQ